MLHGLAPPPVPVPLVYPQARLVAPKLRGFVDLAQRRLGERLATDLAVDVDAVRAAGGETGRQASA